MCSFEPLLAAVGDDCEKYYPLCPYGKKCTYGSRCKYTHRKPRDEISTDLAVQNLPVKTIDHFEQVENIMIVISHEFFL